MDDLRRRGLATLIVVGLVLYVIGPDRIGSWLDRGSAVDTPSEAADDGRVATAPAERDPGGGDGGVARPVAPADSGRAIVLSVSDGDTVHLDIRTGAPGRADDDVRARLLRIDAPELARDGRPAECGAGEARDRLADLLPTGSEVRVAWDVEVTDQYGRDLVHLWTSDGTWVNGTLLAEGRAREVLFRPNDGYDDQVLALEATARRAGLGMWSC